jgi:hypothetical protein
MTYVRDHHLPVVPGLGSGEAPQPIPSVPRISDWQDLVLLLQQI